MATITDLAMKAKPTDKEQWLTQPFSRGAGVFLGRITPSGERLFYFRYTDSKGGRPFLPIGSFHPKGQGGGLTVAQAYAIAADWSRTYQAGARDLREHFEQQRADREQAEQDARRAAELARQQAEDDARQQAEAAARRRTIRKLFEEWQRVELTPQTLADGTRKGRKDGGEWVRQAFERRLFPKLGEVAAEDVKRAELLAVLDEAKAAGKLRTANKLLTDLRQMFRFAAEREIVNRNPLEGIKRANVGGKETDRDRVLSDEEVKALWCAVPDARMAPRSALAVWLILATACRVGEAMGARWEHIDTERRTWYLPDTKNERDHTIHLSDFALAQVKALAELREVCDDGKVSPWLFPATDAARPVCIKSFGKQLGDRQREPEQRMSNRTKATQALALAGGRWTAHDLRRTAATVMARLGVSTDVIDECLNHMLQSKVARVYIKDRRLTEQARAFDALGRKLSELTEGRAAGQVIEFRAA